MPTIVALFTVLARNLRLGVRRPDLIVQTIAVPVVALGLASIMFGSADAWPAALTDEADSVASAQVVADLAEIQGTQGPYFDLIEMSATEARGLVEDGNLQVALTLTETPDGGPEVAMRTYNINSDAMKNVRLRIIAAANAHDVAAGDQQVQAQVRPDGPRSVPRAAFMGGSAIILALLLGSCLITANLVVSEPAGRTTREIALTPLGVPIAMAGASASGMLWAGVTALPTAVMAWAFGFRAGLGSLAMTALVLVPAMAASAGLGALIATRLRTPSAVQAPVILLALGTYFAGGGFMPVAGLPPLARGIAAWWPPSWVFEWCNPLLQGFATELPPRQAVGAVVMLLAGAGASWLAGYLEQRLPAPTGQ